MSFTANRDLTLMLCCLRSTVSQNINFFAKFSKNSLGTYLYNMNNGNMITRCNKSLINGNNPASSIMAPCCFEINIVVYCINLKLELI